MKTGESLLSVGKFIAEYSAHLMGAGVHTSTGGTQHKAYRRGFRTRCQVKRIS